VITLIAKDPRSPRRRVTLSDVAERAGVSIAAVSYVLNGRGGVGEEKRRHILQIAEDLGFRPNRLAKGLRDGRSKVLGLLLADIANPFYPEIAAGVLDAAAEIGYEVFLGHTGDRSIVQLREVGALLDHRCDGLIFTSLTDEDRPLLSRLLEDQVPFVQVVRRVTNVPADFVGIDDEAGGRQSVCHLLSLGYRDLAIVAGPRASSASRNRARGFERALAEHGIVLPAGRRVECELHRDKGYQAASQLFDRAGRPDAVACGNDVIALGVIDAIIDRGWKVPDDIAVIGYDDMSFASSRLVELSTVRQPREQMGREAVRLITERIEEPSLQPREVVLSHELVVRRTCGALLHGPR
jgi:LacI family transcriptional regulator